ncbi:MAG TPA: SUMF1/EgtB/PvdO family nonheme iron enzyme, partial [Polyangiaceae bacterium]|nr:SUMF1/EgtB/PvdO family nonheme iron enzyme [Polyangiaceae bacterium]
IVAPAARAPRCPSEMVLVPPSLCVDRYESALADVESGTLLSPYYAATPNLMAGARGDFATRRERTGDLFARALPLPALSEWQSTANITPIAIPLRDVQPSGYVTGLVARAACEAAGKRLCKLDEWRKACKGSMGAQFPYGPTYREAACNVATKEHPAALLHDNASIGHLDPRLDALSYPGAPRPFPAGSIPTCASRWGDDAIYDMVGNIDEWVDEKGGAFAGGFFARGTTNGCEAIVTAHPESYLDYSTGVRCCRDAAAE